MGGLTLEKLATHTWDGIWRRADCLRKCTNIKKLQKIPKSKIYKIIKTNSKYELCNIYIYYKIKFIHFLRFFEKIKCFQTFRKYFGIVGLFCTINRYFEYRIRILCIFLYMGTWCKDIFRHFPTPKIELFRPPPKSNFFSEVWSIFASRIFGPKWS